MSGRTSAEVDQLRSQMAQMQKLLDERERQLKAAGVLNGAPPSSVSGLRKCLLADVGVNQHAPRASKHQVASWFLCSASV